MIGGSGGPLIPGGGGGGFSRSSGGAYQPAVVTGRVFDPLVMKRLWGYLRPFKRQLWLTLLLVIITAGMQLTGPFLLKVAIDEYIVTTKDFGGLSVLAVVFGLTLLIAYSSPVHPNVDHGAHYPARAQPDAPRALCKDQPASIVLP